MHGDVDITYEFWSPKKHDRRVPISTIKRMTDLPAMQEELKKLRDTLMEYYTVQ